MALITSDYCYGCSQDQREALRWVQVTLQLRALWRIPTAAASSPMEYPYCSCKQPYGESLLQLQAALWRIPTAAASSPMENPYCSCKQPYGLANGESCARKQPYGESLLQLQAAAGEPGAPLGCRPILPSLAATRIG